MIRKQKNQIFIFVFYYRIQLNREQRKAAVIEEEEAEVSDMLRSAVVRMLVVDKFIDFFIKNNSALFCYGKITNLVSQLL